MASLFLLHLGLRVTDSVLLPVRSYLWIGRLKAAASTVLTWITFVMLIQRLGTIRNKKTREYDIIYGILGLGMLLFLIITYENNRHPRLVAKKELSLRVIEQFAYSFCVYFNENLDQRKMQRSQRLLKEMRSLVDSDRTLLKELINALLVAKCTPGLTIAGTVGEYKVKVFGIFVEFLQYLASKGFDSDYLKMIQALTYQTQLDLKWKAIEMVEKIDKYRGILTDAAMFNLITKVEKTMQDAEIISNENNGVDVTLVLKFTEAYGRMQCLMAESLELKEFLWYELTSDYPGADQVRETGVKIYGVEVQIKETFEEIQRLNSSHIQSLYLYGNYLDLVLNQNTQAMVYLEEAMLLWDSFRKSEEIRFDKRLEYLRNPSLAVLTIRGNKHERGIVNSVNSYALRVFQIRREEIIGFPVETLMPHIFSENHATWMERYFQGNKETVMNVERNVYPMDSFGFIVFSSLLVKVMPEVINGIQMIGNINRIKSKHICSTMILFDANFGDLYGVSRDCFNSFGIHPGFCYKENQFARLKIQQIFPKLDLAHLDRYVGNKTLLQIDTTGLKFNSPVINVTRDLHRPLLGSKAYRSMQVVVEIKKPVSFGIDKLAITELIFYDPASVNSKGEVNELKKQRKSEKKRLKIEIFKTRTTKSGPMSQDLNEKERQKLELEELKKAEKVRKVEEVREAISKGSLSKSSTKKLYLYIISGLVALLVLVRLVSQLQSIAIAHTELNTARLVVNRYSLINLFAFQSRWITIQESNMYPDLMSSNTTERREQVDFTLLDTIDLKDPHRGCLRMGYVCQERGLLQLPVQRNDLYGNHFKSQDTKKLPLLYRRGNEDLRTVHDKVL